MFGVAPTFEDMSASQVCALLMHLHSEPADRMIAVRATWNHLKSVGAAPAHPLGRGTKAAYSPREVYQSIFAFELQRAGLMPMHVAKLVLPNLDDFIASVVEVRSLVLERDLSRGRTVEFWIDGAAIRSLIDSFLAPKLEQAA